VRKLVHERLTQVVEYIVGQQDHRPTQAVETRAEQERAAQHLRGVHSHPLRNLMTKRDCIRIGRDRRCPQLPHSPLSQQQPQPQGDRAEQPGCKDKAGRSGQ